MKNCLQMWNDQSKEWQWVFCRNDGHVVTGCDKQHALPGDAISYFQRWFADCEFRVGSKL